MQITTRYAENHIAFGPLLCACEPCQPWKSATLLVESTSLTAQAGAVTGTIAAFVEGPIDFYKSQIQVQIIRSRADPNYKRTHAC